MKHEEAYYRQGLGGVVRLPGGEDSAGGDEEEEAIRLWTLRPIRT